jgi:hypothetical protein
MLLDGLEIERVDLSSRGGSSCSGNLTGQGINLSQCAARKEYLRPITRKGTRHRATNRTTCAIYHCILALK